MHKRSMHHASPLAQTVFLFSAGRMAWTLAGVSLVAAELISRL
jgi:hypothetical protein